VEDRRAELYKRLRVTLTYHPGKHRIRVAAAPYADGPTPAAPPTTMVEPLSGRETDVLRLLGSDLSGPDIARQLHVTLATVRTYTQRIYAKLGVNNRRPAVRRAHQLDLFPRAGR
jgi:LuxR family maltose regulon positive regulatory protein